MFDGVVAVHSSECVTGEEVDFRGAEAVLQGVVDEEVVQLIGAYEEIGRAHV